MAPRFFVQFPNATRFAQRSPHPLTGEIIPGAETRTLVVENNLVVEVVALRQRRPGLEPTPGFQLFQNLPVRKARGPEPAQLRHGGVRLPGKFRRRGEVTKRHDGRVRG